MIEDAGSFQKRLVFEHRRWGEGEPRCLECTSAVLAVPRAPSLQLGHQGVCSGT